VNHFAVAMVVFICVFGSALIGMFMRRVLPEHHLSDDSITVIKLATGLIATMAALVLGLLISSAKGTFDTASIQLVNNAAQVIQFDRVLARYGPQTQEIRILLKHNYSQVIDILASGDTARLDQLNSPETIKRAEVLERKVEALTPVNDEQVALKAHALQIMDQVFAARWLTLLQAKGSIPLGLLIALVAWLSMISGAFGMFAPANGTLIVALALCALSTSGAILLIEELNRPLDGMVGVSVAPMRDTLSRLGE